MPSGGSARPPGVLLMLGERVADLRIAYL